MMVFNAAPSAATANLRSGDVGRVKKGLAHSVDNTGSTDRGFQARFRSDRREVV